MTTAHSNRAHPLADFRYDDATFSGSGLGNPPSLSEPPQIPLREAATDGA